MFFYKTDTKTQKQKSKTLAKKPANSRPEWGSTPDGPFFKIWGTGKFQADGVMHVQCVGSYWDWEGPACFDSNHQMNEERVGCKTLHWTRPSIVIPYHLPLLSSLSETDDMQMEKQIDGKAYQIIGACRFANAVWIFAVSRPWPIEKGCWFTDGLRACGWFWNCSVAPDPFWRN